MTATDDFYPLLVAAAHAYGLDTDRLGAYRAIAGDDHGDLHFYVAIGPATYSFRLLKQQRYQHDIYVELSDDVLCEQMRLCDFLARHNTPFMRRVKNPHNKSFISFIWHGETYRLVVFHWIDHGQLMPASNPGRAKQIAQTARRFHDLSTQFASVVLPRTNHIDGYRAWVRMIRSADDYTSLSPRARAPLDQHLSQADAHITRAAAADFESTECIIQFDFTAGNVLWDTEQKIAGIVDFEKCQYSERTQVLAWLIKTYARTQDTRADRWSREWAQTILQSYGANEVLTVDDMARLPSLTWLAGCMHAHFAQQTLEIIAQPNCAPRLHQHLQRYAKRGAQFEALYTAP